MQVTADTLHEVVVRLAKWGHLSLDSETTGLEEYDRPFSFSIADSEMEYNFDSRVIPGLWQHPSVLSLFHVQDHTWILQNPKFDLRMLEAMGMRPKGKIIDLTVAARLVRNDHFQYSLAAQAKRAGYEKSDAVEKYIKEHGLYEVRKDNLGQPYKQPQFDKVPLELISAYAQKDARITYDLYMRHYLPVIEADPGSRQVMSVETALSRVCYQMERTGMYLNRQYTIEAKAYEEEQIHRMKGDFLALTGKAYVNSAKSIGPLLDGYELPKTEDGNPSLTDDVLESIIVGGSPKAKEIASTVRLLRKAEKRVGTYYNSYLAKVGDDNIIHPSMWPGGTRTRRFSYSDPNLQNLHKDKKSEAPFVVRGCFQPRPGNIFLSFDYEQMEYKMMIAYANDRRIIEAIRGGMDFHQATADALGIDRDTAKTLNFAILYGAGDEKVAFMLGCTIQEASILRTKYFMAMPKVEEFINKVIAVGKTRGYVTNWAGYRLHARWDFCYALPNHLIQSGGADVCKLAMVRLAEKYSHHTVPMVVQIHDQLVFDVPKNIVDRKLITGIQEIMENAWPEKNGVRLTVEPSWSERSLAARDFTKGYAA